MREAARLFLRTSPFQRIQAVRSRRDQVRYLRHEGFQAHRWGYVEWYGTVVRYGPFAELQYPSEATLNRHVLPELFRTPALHGTGRLTICG
jgi:hypothetical protein